MSRGATQQLSSSCASSELTHRPSPDSYHQFPPQPCDLHCTCRNLRGCRRIRIIRKSIVPSLAGRRTSGKDVTDTIVHYTQQAVSLDRVRAKPQRRPTRTPQRSHSVHCLTSPLLASERDLVAAIDDLSINLIRYMRYEQGHMSTTEVPDERTPVHQGQGPISHLRLPVLFHPRYPSNENSVQMTTSREN
jgi:hypothetical protein